MRIAMGTHLRRVATRFVIRNRLRNTQEPIQRRTARSLHCRDCFRFVAGTCGQQPHREQRHHRRCTTGGNQRQLQTSHWQGTNDVANVDEGLHHGCSSNRAREQTEKRIVLATGDTKSHPAERCIEQNNHQRAEETSLLTDNGENEVILRLR